MPFYNGPIMLNTTIFFKIYIFPLKLWLTISILNITLIHLNKIIKKRGHHLTCLLQLGLYNRPITPPLLIPYTIRFLATCTTTLFVLVNVIITTHRIQMRRIRPEFIDQMWHQKTILLNFILYFVTNLIISIEPLLIILL